MKTSYYSNYYGRTINSHATGLKLVLGGTGLGKTSGIVQTILNHPNEDERKFIYVANRIQLLEELKRSVGLARCVHLKSNYDLFKDSDLLPLLTDEPLIKKYYGYLKSIGSVRVSFQKFINGYKRTAQYIDDGFDDKNYIEGKISSIISCFRNIIKEAYKNSTDNNISNNDFGFTQNDYQSLIKNPSILSIFPYLEFKNNSQKKLLLVTIHKAFKGFFDGKKTINLNQFKGDNGNNIIILDEFDFLENDLLQLICDEPDLEHPFKFVSAFYQAMAVNKLPSANYLNNSPEFKDRIKKIIEGIEYLEKIHKIKFPEIVHFVCTNDAVKGKAIFQTNYTIVESKLYLNDNNRENSFDLTFEETKLKAFILFDVVKNSAIKIIKLFNDLEDENILLYRELLRHCFETSDAFKRLIKSMYVFPKVGKDVTTNYEYLHYNGFSLYEIKEFTNAQADTEEVKFKYYSIHETPEKIILNLAKNNLVFGLSATGEIPRLVKNFDINWFAKQLGNNFHETSSEDINDINKANKAKIETRKNSVKFELANYNSSGEHNDFVEIVASLGLYNEDGEDVFKSNNKYCKDRLKHFLSTLVWIDQSKTTIEKKSDTHLIFVSSFKQILAFFNNCDSQHEDNLYSFETIIDNTTQFKYYEITVKKTTSIVVFFDAQQAKLIQNNKNTEDFYNSLFWQKKTVILITTFNSAGNGINLQYYKAKKGYRNRDRNDLRDFKNIHLLDSPFFYFSSIDHRNTENENSIIKQNIYYLSKLEKSNLITQKQFKSHLNRIRKCGDYNSEYLESTEDGLFNQLSVFIQALGRIERVWNPMDDQTIRLGDNAFRVFEEFFKLDERLFIKNKIAKYFSNNIVELFQQIGDQHQKTQDDISDLKEERLKKIDGECKAFINLQLNRLDLLRQGQLDKDNSKNVREDWETIRRISLRHNFNHPIAQENSFVFTTPYYKDGKLNINQNSEIIPIDLIDSNFKYWNLDGIYKVIRENEIIRKYFRIRGYQLGFDNHHQFFVPYFYQSILSGAIGEEAIKAILIKNSLPLDESEIPNELFELADSKIKGKSWFIDFKNYGQRTIRNFSLPPDDPFYHLKLNEKKFKDLSIRKWNAINSFYKSTDCKLIYLNLLGDEESIIRYYDENFNIIDNNFLKARIIVVPAVLSRDGSDAGYNKLTEGFTVLLDHLLKK